MNAEPSRQIIDRLPESFPVDRDESEWLLTLLSADELDYIFSDRADHARP